jgi:hypothetical protein
VPLARRLFVAALARTKQHRCAAAQIGPGPGATPKIASLARRRPVAQIYCKVDAPIFIAIRPCCAASANTRPRTRHFKFVFEDVDSAALADKLQQEIDSGRTERFAVIHAAEQELTPNEECDLCNGTGILRPPAVGERGTGDMLTGIKCNACDGSGFAPGFLTHYPFSVDNVRNFVAFLRRCGATTRAGRSCRQAAVRGRRRGRMHGGAKVSRSSAIVARTAD